MIEAGQRAQAAGLRMSVMVLTGLAGELRSGIHAQATAEALNQMQPRLLSALRLIPAPGTPLHDGRDGSPTRPRIDKRPARRSGPTFKMLTEHQAMHELREMIARLELESTVFRADHSSNIIPLEGRFPKNKMRLLAQLDALFAFDLREHGQSEGKRGHTPNFEQLVSDIFKYLEQCPRRRLSLPAAADAR